LQGPESVLNICRQVARSKTESTGDNIQRDRVDLVLLALRLRTSRPTHLSCRGSVPKLLQKDRVEVVGRVVESYNAKVHRGAGRSHQQLHTRHQQADSRNPDFPVFCTSGPVHTIHLGIALTVIHQTPPQHLVFVWSQKVAVCWPICEPPIHDDAYDDSDTSLDDEYPVQVVSCLAYTPRASGLTISTRRILGHHS
jgi:hypothetical protein